MYINYALRRAIQVLCINFDCACGVSNFTSSVACAYLGDIRPEVFLYRNWDLEALRDKFRLYPIVALQSQWVFKLNRVRLFFAKGYFKDWVIWTDQDSRVFCEDFISLFISLFISVLDIECNLKWCATSYAVWQSNFNHVLSNWDCSVKFILQVRDLKPTVYFIESQERLGWGWNADLNRDYIVCVKVGRCR